MNNAYKKLANLISWINGAARHVTAECRQYSLFGILPALKMLALYESFRIERRINTLR